jgi:hypothetical protein
MLFNGFSVIPRVRHATSGTIEKHVDQQLKPKTKGNYDVILKDFLLLIVRKEEIKDTIFEISFTLPTALIFLHISPSKCTKWTHLPRDMKVHFSCRS